MQARWPPGAPSSRASVSRLIPRTSGGKGTAYDKPEQGPKVTGIAPLA